MKTKIWILIGIVVVFVVLATVIFSTRQPGKNRLPLDRQQFVSLYVDLEILAEQTGIGTPEYEVDRDSVLAVYSATINDVTEMLSAYDAKPEEWAKVWDEILAELRKRQRILVPDSTATD